MSYSVSHPDLQPSDFDNAYLGDGDFAPLKLPRHPRPRTYLQFAIDDLAMADAERTRVNALSNAKRALDFQVETISNALGFNKSNDPRSPFPRRLEFCAHCGVVSPRILNRLNRLRNAIEHEYYLPDRSVADDFVDVVELFLVATHPLVTKFPVRVACCIDEMAAMGKMPADAEISMKPGSGILRINARVIDEDGKIVKNGQKFRQLIRVGDGKLYTDWASVLLRISAD